MYSRLTTCTLLLLFFVNHLFGQCVTEQLFENDWITTSGQLESQVWTAECDGDLEMVEVWPDELYEGSPTFTFYLRAYDGCANLWEVPGIQAVAGEISTVILADGSGDTRTVVGGTKYMLAFIGDTDEEPSRFKLANNNPYAGGSYAITTENDDPWCDDFFPSWDLWFRASVDEALSPLPVELSSFDAHPNEEDRSVILKWATSLEENNFGFEIQRSLDGENWRNIDFVEGNGTTDSPRTYSYIDAAPFQGDNYYRLKQIDYNGDYAFSSVEHALLTPGDEKFMSVYPNPSNGHFTIDVYNPRQRTTTAKLFASTGALIWKQRFHDGEMPVSWRKNFDLPQEEVYFLVVQIGEIIESQKIVIIDKK